MGMSGNGVGPARKEGKVIGGTECGKVNAINRVAFVWGRQAWALVGDQMKLK